MNVRRLAAIDMHGAKGTRLRAKIILVEFILGAVAGPLLGLTVVIASDDVGWQLFGLWLLGSCLNYIPVAIYAIGFTRREALTAELAGADILGELRYYTKAQVWVFVPLAVIVFDLRQRRERAAEPDRRQAVH